MVVSDAIARQLDWRDGEDYLVAANAPLFAANCIRLYRDENLWQKLRSNALKRVETELNESRSAETLSAVITKLIGNRRMVSAT